MLIYLTGFMGAGKSSIGRRLSHRLELSFVDLDQEIESQAGRSISAIFSIGGENAFRQLENEALLVSTRLVAAVVATGGGVVLRSQNIETMRGAGRVVWLNPSFETLADRLLRSDRGERPLFESRAQARRLYEQRLDAYSNCDLRIDIDGAEPADEVVDRIVRELREEPCAT